MLQLLGKCSGADRVYIFDKKEKNRKEYFCLQYEWKNEDDILEKEQLFSEITVEDIPHWTDELKKGLTIQVTDCEELSPMEQEYNLMKKRHTYSRVLAPIFSRDHLSGFIGMDHFYKGISELFIHQLAFVGAHLNTARENLRMFTLLGKNLESMEKERQILNVLCEDCTSVYKVNLLDDTAEVVKLEQGANAPKILKNREKIILCYSKELKYYYDHFVIKESAPDFLETFDCQNLIGELKTRDKISRRYQSRENANRHQYFEIRATRLPSSTDFPVLIAFRHVDEIIKEERNHQRELEDSLAEVKMNNEIRFITIIRYHIPYDIDLSVEGDSYHEILNVIREIFNKIEAKYPNQKKGIFLANDTYANMFLNLIFQKYGTFPSTYEIVGFDNSPIASEAILPITTIGQQINVIAKTAMDLLIQQMENQKKRVPKPLGKPIHKQITPILIRRNTTE